MFRKYGSNMRKLKITALITVFCLVFCAAGSLLQVKAAAKDLPIYCVQNDGNNVSLTFDAAWGNEDTQLLIDILGKYNVKATFFVVASWAEKYPESVKALSDAGHEVMNHSSTHPHFTKLSADQIEGEVKNCNDKVEAITGVRPILFRPPFGDYDDHVVKTLRDMGMYTIQWDVDSLDWKDLPASEITSRVTSRVKPGSIILFHNAAKHTPEALPGIIEWLLKNEYKPVKVSEIIYKDNFTINHEGRQIPK
jgi:Predicted xylanase/chitin deacetylase